MYVSRVSPVTRVTYDSFTHDNFSSCRGDLSAHDDRRGRFISRFTPRRGSIPVWRYEEGGGAGEELFPL